ncbi:hypothetical protein L249_7460 [Ophiocordyceps polyrhachis-furcata BCC 54312]|uniref:cystathionine gamma-synthase n=1 Tax=Ophiocordyceps polyrhachis-furcata BCC 54312 TaxID=1330021 RepID=A0A367L9H9_9HYPO|nr:hypothetical protein L249_7460 [Ophiocordyceps polyrhachis-furcata BCC 54312]
MPRFILGQSIPPDTAHAISVSLPTWKSNVGYEEGQEWVISKLETGYPRFHIHESIKALTIHIRLYYGRPGQQAMLFSTLGSATRCIAFIRRYAMPDMKSCLNILDLVVDVSKSSSALLRWLCPTLHVAFFDEGAYGLAKQYWQHTGDGVSSRRAEFYFDLLRNGILIPRQAADHQSQFRLQKGPRRYMSKLTYTTSVSPDVKSFPYDQTGDHDECCRFLEERFGRNLDFGLVEQANLAIRRRIAGFLTHDSSRNEFRLASVNPSFQAQQDVKEDDVFLFPNGMNAIFNVHRTLLSALGQFPSVSFGFPYVDTLKILQKFGPGCMFLGRGSSDDLDELESLLRSGERYLALFCEFPGNPLLTCPDLQRIRSLADRFDFSVIVDETIGTFANINVLPLADIVVSSLTKIFSGDSNVMGGSVIFNPHGRHYALLKRVMVEEVYEDAYWPGDIIFMERNSRDFVPRVRRINVNAETICHVLRESSLVKRLYYPMFNPSRDYYDARRLPQGGYGGLVSVIFHYRRQAEAFFDAINTAKGPSLGTNFTICSPYVILAHYQELAWAAEFGVQSDLVRISVGLEDTESLKSIFKTALHTAEQR